MPIDHKALDKALARLNAEQLLELETSDALARVVDATQELFNVTGGGLMFLDEDEALHYVAASDEPSRTLEAAQAETGVGPCVDALVLGRVVATNDLLADDRWPGLAERVVPAGIRAVLGVPVALAGGAVGSLNVYSDQPHEWDITEERAIRAFTDLIGQIVVTAVLQRRHGELIDQLQFALDHRVTIERAVGLLMGREDLDAVQAFNRLRAVARAERRRVAEVAAELLAAT